MIEPRLDWCLTIDVLLGPEQLLGRIEAGERIDYPIIGGRFTGPGLTGEVLTGGADNFLMRNDGIGVLDAVYRLQTDDGAVIGIRNRGLWVPDERGLAKLAAGGEPAADELYCRCTPVFDAPAGRYDWLNRQIFVGRVDYPRPREVSVTCWKVT
jgi:hypothetical protein